ncbi:MAG: hypothetical protein ABW133_15845 [Polyangiaceae bacterium]
MANFIARAVFRPFFLVAAIGALANCSDGRMPTSDTSAQASPLLRVQLSKKHSVEVYELEPGYVAYFEQGSIDDGEIPVDKSDWGQLTASQVYQRLKPGEAVPGALSGIDERVAARRAASKEAPIPPPLPSSDKASDPGPGVKIALPPGPSDRDKQRVPTEQPKVLSGAATSDEIAAQKGALNAPSSYTDAEWWGVNFCSTWQVHNVWCPAGVGSATDGWNYAMHYEAYAASFSFNSSATFFVDTWNGAPVRLSTQTIAPRTWSSWWWTGAERWYTGGVSGDGPEMNVAYSRRVRNAIPGFSFTGWDSNNAEHQFDNDIEGVTHDSQYWYFARVDTAWGDNVGRLGTPFHVSWNLQYSSPNEIDIGSWESMNDHFGDITQAYGLLYIPMFSNDNTSICYIGVFNPATQQPVQAMQVPVHTDCSWIAFNPKDGLFYMPEGNALKKFSIGSSIYQIGSNLTILGMDGNPAHRWQGAEFSPRGNLYLWNGFPPETRLRFYGVDPYTGQAYLRHYWDLDTNWEAEGLTVWDLTSGQAPEIHGHVHLQFLRNRNVTNDELYFGHFLADDPSRL